MPKQILLADDSLTIAKIVQITFAHEDYAVQVAHSGDEALQRARQARPDLVLLDAGMPGKSGYDACADLRAAGLRDVPVLILTNNFVPYDEARGQRSGATGFVIKPFETQALLDKVNQLINGGPAAVAAPARAVVPVAPTHTTATPPTAAAPMAAAPPRPSAPARPAATTPSMPVISTPAPTMPSMPVVTVPSRPSSAPSIPAMPASYAPPPPPLTPPPAAAAPMSSRSNPRATLMGIPTVGPDGLPMLALPPTAHGPAPLVPAPSPRPSAPAPVAARPPAAPAREPAPVNFSFTPPSVASVPAPSPASVASPSPSSPSPSSFAGELRGRPAESMRPPVAAPAPPPPIELAPAASAAPALRSIPANTPRMPRPSLIPNAPTPGPVAARAVGHDALAGVVSTVTAATASQLSQALGGYAMQGSDFEAVAKLSREVIERIAWEVVPELAEILIRGELDRLVRERQGL